ncbi:porin family protein [Hymenobacter sp. HD11105]
MKKSILLVSALLGWSLATQAQSTVQVGVKTGLSLAVLDGTINTGAEYKPSFHVGGVLRWRPSARVAIQPELIFSQQGYQNPSGPFTLENKTNLSYLNLPVLVKVYLGNVFNVHLGPQFGLLLAAQKKGDLSITSNGGVVSGEEEVKKFYKSDFGVCAGLGADLKNGLLLAARFNYGLSDIDNNALTQQVREQAGFGGLHNRVLEVSVGYVFGSR